MRRLALPLVLGLCAPALATATTVLELDLPERVKRSDYIVRGEVLSEEVQMVGGRPLTRTRVAVRESLKGNPGPELVVERLGGAMGKVRLSVPGDPGLEIGEEVLLFLQCRRGVEHCYLVGLGQGKYALRQASGRLWAVQEVAGLRAVQGQRPLAAEAPRSYEALKASLRPLILRSPAQVR